MIIFLSLYKDSYQIVRLTDDMRADSQKQSRSLKEKGKQGTGHANEPNSLQIMVATTHAKCINAREFTLGAYEQMFNYRNATIDGRQKLELTSCITEWHPPLEPAHVLVLHLQNE